MRFNLRRLRLLNSFSGTRHAAGQRPRRPRDTD
jgi:hypothetical protein